MRILMLRMLGIATAIAVSVIMARETRACSQCLCGQAVQFGLFQTQDGPGLRLGLDDRYLSKENGLDDAPGAETEREHRVGLFASQRVGSGLLWFARLPYSFKELEERPEGEASSTGRNDGLGDLEGVVQVRIASWAQGMASSTSLGLVLGGSAPTGSNNAQGDNGERLEEHLQTGIGAWSGTGGLELAAPLGAWGFNASLMGRGNGTNDAGYHYGNALLYNAGAMSPPIGSIQWSLQLNGRSAARDRTDQGDEPNTGGSMLYVAPGLRWQPAAGFATDLLVQVPVVQSLYGVQQEHATARIAISMVPSRH